MPRKAPEPLEKRGHEIILYEGDWDELRHICAASGVDLQPSVLVRNLVRKFLRKVNAKSSLTHKSLPDDLDIDTGSTDESGVSVQQTGR